MKKALWIAGLTVFILWCSGCSLIDKTAIPFTEEPAPASVSPGATPSAVNTAPSGVTPDETNVTDGGAAPTDTAEEPQTSSPTPPASGGDEGPDYASYGEELMKSDGIGDIRLDMADSALIDVLGEPAYRSMPVVWGADDSVHSDWEYEGQGITVNMVQVSEDGAFAVFSVKIMEPCSLETARGAAVGASKDSVMDLYKEEYNAGESSENVLVFGTVYGGMLFTFDEDAVVEIFFGAASE